MNKKTVIELFKENMKFSAGHFTIFSAKKRENFHGHNFKVQVSLGATFANNGMPFNYSYYKERVKKTLLQLNEVFLLPANSKYLTIKKTKNSILAQFGKEKMTFLKRDVRLLPLENITVEELASYLLLKIRPDPKTLKKHGIYGIKIKVFSGPGQSASAMWGTL